METVCRTKSCMYVAVAVGSSEAVKNPQIVDGGGGA